MRGRHQEDSVMACQMLRGQIASHERKGMITATFSGPAPLRGISRLLLNITARRQTAGRHRNTKANNGDSFMGGLIPSGTAS